jgi:hypothetical protein
MRQHITRDTGKRKLNTCLVDNGLQSSNMTSGEPVNRIYLDISVPALGQLFAARIRRAMLAR